MILNFIASVFNPVVILHHSMEVSKLRRCFKRINLIIPCSLLQGDSLFLIYPSLIKSDPKEHPQIVKTKDLTPIVLQLWLDLWDDRVYYVDRTVGQII